MWGPRGHLIGCANVDDITQPAPTDWADQAACRGTNPALWFPHHGNSDAERAAKAICAGCPVQAECLEEGLREKHGIWGGLTPPQRDKERRRRRRNGTT